MVWHWDHPRACGEHSICCCASLIVVGSSPRLRGTPDGDAERATEHGIIPALAGNTLRVLTSSVSTGDHPRACGEHLASLDQQRFDRGSSPRLRGTQTLERVCASGRGIIPALAGNTRRLAQRVLWHGDHPRACGEHQKKEYGTGKPMGSSPRLRGTLHGLCAVPDGGGIIPALAGNTALCLALDKHHRDHPRACGEH